MISLINVIDYPRDSYSAYWEIVINQDTFDWLAKIMSYADSKVVASHNGKAKDMDAARTASQQWVLSKIETYRRG